MLGGNRMAEHSLRIKKEVYSIEVNENGDTIEFDLKDIGIGNKYLNAIDEINKEQKRFVEEKEKIFQNYNLEMEDIKKINIENGVGRDIYQLEMSFFENARKILDGVLGDGACQKIFGNSNYPEMFEELNEALKPHFKNMKIDVKARQRELLKKYKSGKGKSNNRVLR